MKYCSQTQQNDAYWGKRAHKISDADFMSTGDNRNLLIQNIKIR